MKRIYFGFILFLSVFTLFFALSLGTAAEELGTPTLTLEPSLTEVVYGDSLLVTATLTDTAPLEDVEIAFTLGSLTHTTHTDTTGKATWKLDMLTLGAQTTYHLTATAGTLSTTADVTVTQRPLTYVGMTIADKEYDGTNDVTIQDPGTLTGLLAGDNVTVLPLFKFTSQDVGSNKSVVLKDYTLQGSKRLNYVFVAPALTASITPKRVTLQGIVTTPFVYNGTPLQEVVIQNGYTLSGILDGEADAAYLHGIRAYVCSPNASKAQQVAFDPSVTHLVGDLAMNYELLLPTDVTVEISPALLTVSVDKVTINKGQSIPTLTANATGFVNGEAAATLEGFALPVVTPDAVNTLNAELTAFTVTYSGGNATGNYAFQYRQTVELKINRVNADSSHYALSTNDLSVWHNAPITVTPAGGYASLTADLTDGSLSMDELRFSPTLQLHREGECTVFFALRHTDGTVTEPVILSYKLDTVAPTGNVLWRSQSILSEAPAFRYFSKSAISLQFLAADNAEGSGIAALEYALNESGPFVSLDTDTAEIATAPGLYNVFLRVVDEAGNVTLLRTDGLVLYRDTTAADLTLSYQRLSQTGASLPVTWNGNTPAALYNSTGEPLEGALFSVDENGLLTVSADFLSGLPAGTHTLTLSIDPLGVSFTENSVNDAPSALTLTITVTRVAPQGNDFTVLWPENMAYDGSEKIPALQYPQGMGTVTIYYIDNNGNRLNGIKNVGTYTIKIDTAVGADYESSSELTVGTVTITKMTPAAPQLSYNAATGVLSGDTAGLVYSLDGRNYSPVPSSFLQIVTGPCTLYFYLPGDGLNTENSQISLISVTRAAQPATVTVNESLFAACDGKIYAAVSGLEYRHVNEDGWHAVAGSAITDLAPGSYAVRVAAAGTALESHAVILEILAAPEFIPLEKEASLAGQPKVVLRGQLTARSAPALIALCADPSASSTLRSLSVIDQRTTEIIGFFDLSLNGRHSGTLELDVYVGELYNGRTLTVYRENENGAVESHSVLCENGMVTLRVDSLSPILIATPMTTPRGMGSTAWIWILVVLAALAVAVVVWLEIAHRKKKKA